MPTTYFTVMYNFLKTLVVGLKIRKYCCLKGQKIYTDMSKFSLIHSETNTLSAI